MLNFIQGFISISSSIKFVCYQPCTDSVRSEIGCFQYSVCLSVCVCSFVITIALEQFDVSSIVMKLLRKQKMVKSSKMAALRWTAACAGDDVTSLRCLHATVPVHHTAGVKQRTIVHRDGPNRMIRVYRFKSLTKHNIQLGLSRVITIIYKKHSRSHSTINIM